MHRLARSGCHSTDITDALYAPNPDWAREDDKELSRGAAPRSLWLGYGFTPLAGRWAVTK